jgi:hypothetical protein
MSEEASERKQADIGKFIAAYIKLRDIKEEIVKRQKDELGVVSEKMRKVEGFLQASLQAHGLQSFKAEAGTAFLKMGLSTSVEDWDSLLAYVLENSAWDLLTHAVSKEAVKEFMEKHQANPPGVKVTTAQICQVRRN